MLSKLYFRFSVTITLLLVIAGCTFTRTSGQLKESGVNRIARVGALLPIDVASDISRERVALLRKLMRNELSSKGFALVEDSLIEEICADSKCVDGLGKLRGFGALVFFRLSLSSVNRANFLAGYVNNITGVLTISDKDGKELLRIDHIEVERGGLLFNSGLVAQALISTSDNFKGDESFARMATIFSKRIGERVPEPEPDYLEQRYYMLSQPELKTLGGGSHEVCIQSNSPGQVTLQLSSGAINLRRVGDYRYCTILRTADINLAKLVFNLRSPLGEEVRLDFSHNVVPICDPTQKRDVRVVNHELRLDHKCLEDGSLKEVRLYRADQDLGPYSQINVIREPKVVSVRASTENKGVIAVVPVRKDGVILKPSVVKVAQ